MLWRFRATIDSRKSTFKSKFDCRSEYQSHDSLTNRSIEAIFFNDSIELLGKAFVPYFL